MSVHLLPRLFTPRKLVVGQTLDLPPDISHYLVKVLRRKIGDQIRLFNGQEGEFLARIKLAKKILVGVEIISQLRLQTPAPALSLLFAVIKRHRLETMVEKTTELGVGSLCPLITRHTNQKLSKIERLESIIIEAAEQSERLDIPLLYSETSLEKALNAWENNIPLYACFEASKAPSMKDILMQSATDLEANSGRAGILIGPEGGFHPDEINLLKEYDFIKPVSLGPRILKADTAAMMAVALWQSVHGDADQPQPFMR